MKTKRKIKILGAGISGMVAAITLARDGFKVEVFEKRPRIGSFFKRDVHSLRNYCYDYDVIEKYESLGIKISHIYPIFREFRFSPSLKQIEIYSKDKPLFYNFIRGYESKYSFDIELYKIAKDKGVKFCFNQNLNNAEADIIATGANSIKGVAYGKHYSGISDMVPNSLYIFLNNRYSPHGYSYILPFNNEVSVVIASTKKESKNTLKERFNNLKNNSLIIKKILKNAKFENEIFGYAFYNFPRTAIKNGKLYVGEAAGFLDASSGFGTHYAIVSGYLAATAISENKNYDELWKKYFGEELKKKHFKRLVAEKMKDRDYELTVETLLKKYGEKISIKDYRASKQNG